MAAFIAGNFGAGQTVEEISGLLDRYLLEVLSKARQQADPRLHHALACILAHYGVLDLEKDLDAGISLRQLRRLFDFYIGDTPKTFCKVVRFQNILRAKPSVQTLRQNKLFFDAGYYDQAHFIKEFKNFYGVTPFKAFGR